MLLLNPDAVLVSGLEDLAQACERDGLAAGQLVGTDGEPQTGFGIRRLPTAAALCFEALGINRLWPSNPVNRNYRYLDRSPALGGKVEQPAGAFWMIRRDVFLSMGGFDERFHPVWFEDVDFARRALSAGFATTYVPSACARHEGGHSVSRLPGKCRTRYWYVSLLRYTAKHFSGIKFRAVCGAVATGCFARLVAGIFGARKNAGYGEVARLAAKSLLHGHLFSSSVKFEELNEPGGDARVQVVLAAGTALDEASRK
jgi:GT2 family glycosyltransferase